MLHRLGKIDQVEHPDFISTFHQHFPTLLDNGAFRVGNNEAGIHLHQVWLDMKSRLTGTGAADH